MEFFATTFTGLEDVVAKEIAEMTASNVRTDVSKVFFDGDPLKATLLTFTSRCVNKVFVLLLRERVYSLDEIEKVASSIDYSEYIDPEQSFAVRAERHGMHDFTSIDVSSVVGRSIITSYLESRGTRLKVNLDSPDVEFYALLRYDELIIGICMTGRSLHRRFYEAWHHPAGLPATLAFSMLRLNGWDEHKSLLDPFCGSGTIPIEASLAFHRIAPGLRINLENVLRLRFIPRDEVYLLIERLKSEEREPRELPITGSDASPKAIQGAQMNLRAAGLDGTVRFLIGDVMRLSEWIDFDPDCIVTDPPFGVRIGLKDPTAFYSGFVSSITKACPRSRITLITTKYSILRRALSDNSWSIVDHRQILYGSLTAHVITAER